MVDSLRSSSININGLLSYILDDYKIKNINKSIAIELLTNKVFYIYETRSFYILLQTFILFGKVY